MTNNICLGSKYRALLCAGVSAAALSLAVPALAAPLKRTKAPVMAPGEFRAFVSGGVFWTRGDHIPYTARGFENISFPEFPFDFDIDTEGVCFATGIPCRTQTFVDAPGPGDTSLKPNRGWDGAAGFDYRFPGTPWHVNVQARGGQAKGSDAIGSSFDQNTTRSIVFEFPRNRIEFSQSGVLALQGTSVTTAALTERHWQADFGMGYDFFPRLMQVNFGLRVAEVTAIITVTTAASATQSLVNQTPLCAAFTIQIPCNPANLTTLIISGSGFATASNLATDRRSFFGVGPRIGAEGSVPIWGPVTFDYAGNAALLFGNTKITSGSNSGFTNSLTAFAGLVPQIAGHSGPLTESAQNQSGITSGFVWSAAKVVYNFDIEAGLGYWITPGLRLAASYRLDAFINPLRAFPDGKTIDRYYHGPKLTLTGKI